MPVDVDAYMDSKIPSLSRGGSWLPASQPSPLAGAFSMAGRGVFTSNGFPSPPLSPSLSHVSPCSASPYVAAHTESWTHTAAPPGASPSSPAFQLQLPASQSQRGGRPGVAHTAVSAGTPPTSEPVPATPPFLSPSRRLIPAMTHRFPMPQRIEERYRKTSLPDEHHHWERDSGAPRRLAREPDYRHPRPENPVLARDAHPQARPHRRRADSLPSAFSDDSADAVSTSTRHRGQTPRSPLSGLGVEERERTCSGSERQLQARRADLRRPSLCRAATHHQLVSIAEGRASAHSTSGPSPDRKRRSYPNEQARTRVASGSDAPPHAPTDALEVPSLPEPSSPYRKLGRTSSSPQSAGQPESPSPYVKLDRPLPPRRHTHQAGDPGSRSDMSFEVGSRPEASRPGVEDSQRPVGSASGARPAPMDLQSLRHALPGPSPAFKPPSSSRNRHESFGSATSRSDDGYDRYTAHPAAPSPGRTERAAAATPPTNGRSSLSPSRTTDYLPIGYAAPTRPVPWNRDGPAMKTHGVAWKKHTEGLVLPQGPAGPRWDQARPPRVEAVVGGGWWESGGQGH